MALGIMPRFPGAPPLPFVTGKEEILVLPLRVQGDPGAYLASVTIDQIRNGSPGPNTQQPSGNYTAQPGDDAITFNGPASGTVLTLPESSQTADGHVLRVIVRDLAVGSTFTIAPPAGNGFVALGENGWVPVTGNYVMEGPPLGPSGTEFQFINSQSANAWLMVNGGPPVSGYDSAAPGVPLPLPGKVIEQADVVAPPPGNYGASPTDDYVVFESPAAGTTLTLPASAITKDGKILRVTIRDLPTGATFVIQPAIGEQFNVLQHDGWAQLSGSYVMEGPPDGVTGTELLFVNSYASGGWLMINQGPPLAGIDSAFPAVPLPLPGKTLGRTPIVSPPGSYTATGVDDTIIFEAPPNNTTLTLPGSADAADGKVLRVIIRELSLADIFTIAPAGGLPGLVALEQDGWRALGGSYVITSPPTGTELMLLNSHDADSWFMINRGPPLTGVDSATPAMHVRLPGVVGIFTHDDPGAVPAPGAGSGFRVLFANGQWAELPAFMHIPASTILGNLGPAPQLPAPMNGTQVTSILDIFTPVLKGLVPPSGGGATDFLRADGIWADPGGGGGAGVGPIANNTVLGNVSGATASPIGLSAGQVTNLLNIFTATTKGLTPPSGGAATDFLRADGAWVDPLGSVGAPIPNSTVLGNVSGIASTAYSLNQAQLTQLINVFTQTVKGAVPAPGAADPGTNVLFSNGSWGAPSVPASIADQSVLGNVSGAAAAPSALTATQLTALVNAFTQTLSGAVPAPGAADPGTNVLYSNGSWGALPAPAGTSGALLFNDGGSWGATNVYYDNTALPNGSIGTDAHFYFGGGGEIDGNVSFLAGVGLQGYAYFTGTTIVMSNIPNVRPSQPNYLWRDNGFLRIMSPDYDPLFPTVFPPETLQMWPAQVASLPAPSPSITGTRTVVVDAVSQTGLVQGAGTYTIPVFCDGTNWISDFGYGGVSSMAATAPANPSVGTLWYNSNLTALLLWDGSNWLYAGSAVSAGIAPLSALARAAPSHPGDLWFNTGTNQLNVYDGTAWQGLGGDFYIDPQTTLTGNATDYCYKHICRASSNCAGIVEFHNRFGGTDTANTLTFDIKNVPNSSGTLWQRGVAGYGVSGTSNQHTWVYTTNPDNSMDLWLRRSPNASNELYDVWVRASTLRGTLTGPDQTIPWPSAAGDPTRPYGTAVAMFAQNAPMTVSEPAFSAPVFPTTPEIAQDVVLGVGWTGPATPTVTSTFTHTPGSTEALGLEGDFRQEGNVFYQMVFSASQAAGGTISDYQSSFQIILRNGAQNATGQDPVASQFVTGSTVVFRPTGNYTHVAIVPNTAWDGSFTLTRINRFTGSLGDNSFNSVTLTLKDFAIRLRGGNSIYAGNGGLMATGASNTVFGYGSMQRLTSGANNTAVGAGTMTRNSIASNNTTVGAASLGNNHSGPGNTVVGYASMSACTTGSYNVAVGMNALNVTQAGIGNTVVGYQSFMNMGGGTNNTAIGVSTAQHIGNPSSENTALGANAMRYRGTGTTAITTAQKSIFIGSYARGQATDAVSNNQIVIGADAVGYGSNTITLGNSLITEIRAQVATLTAFSDPRLKEDIVPADLDRCLADVKRLPVHRYAWRQEAGAHRDKHVTGWLPDEVAKVFPKAVSTGDLHFDCGDEMFTLEQAKSITMTEALPTLWGAVQRLIARCEELERKLQ